MSQKSLKNMLPLFFSVFSQLSMKYHNMYIIHFRIWNLILYLSLFVVIHLVQQRSTVCTTLQRLCSPKCSSEMLYNLLYFMHGKTHVFFAGFFFSCIFTLCMPWSLPIQSIHKVKIKCKVEWKEKRYMGFLIHKI